MKQRDYWPESPWGWGVLVRTKPFQGFFREEPWGRKVGLSTDVLTSNPFCLFIYLFGFVLSTYFYVTTLLNFLFIYLFAISLNFIRLLRVVITPSVVERRKRLEAIG